MADLLGITDADFVKRIEQAKTHRERVRKLVADVFEPGVHYDRRGGCGKPALFKAGADEALRLFGLAPILTGQAISGDGVTTPHIAVLMKAEARGINDTDGPLLAVSYGGANSFEECFAGQKAWAIQDKIIDLAAERAIINLALYFGLSAIFSLGPEVLDACVQAKTRPAGFALPDVGGSIPLAVDATAVGSPLTPYIKDDPKAVEKKVEEIQWTGDSRKDLVLAASALGKALGQDPGDVLADLSSFTGEGGKKVSGFRSPQTRHSDKWISSTLTRAKKKLQEVGIVAVVSDLPF